MKKYWQKIKRNLLPKQPRTLFTWRFLLPKQPANVVLYRKAFIKSLLAKPYVIRGLLNINSLLLWYLFFAWRNCFRVWKNSGKENVEITGLSSYQQFGKLLTLTLVYSVPAQCFYKFRLYQYPKKQWLSFRFNQQVFGLQAVDSPKIAKKSYKLMTNKYFFAQCLIENNLPAIPTVCCVAKGEVTKAKNIFIKRSLFLKPVDASRAEGCLLLAYNEANQRYYLKTKKTMRDEAFCRSDNCDNVKRDIVDYINQQCQSRNYLVQPLLQNAQQWGEMATTLPLFVVRLVTVFANNKVSALSAILEVPVKGEYVEIYYIDCSTGIIRIPNHCKRRADNYKNMDCVKAFFLQPIPYWQQFLAVANKAHILCQDIKTVGWDVALTDLGILILEGNIHWGQEVHQLETPLVI